MRYVLLVLAVLGIVVSSLALREHYREYGDSPCSINERWDCGVVNHSKYALVGGAVPALASIPGLATLPVATAGIIGYVLMSVLAWLRSYRLLLLFTLAGLAFSLYLANIEKTVLGVWCIYCVISLGIICLLSVLEVTVVISGFVRRPTSPGP
ncbi:MAG TPA: vitamin K epoxide reductase family protein [Candidatus Sulfotelmatobacter sp.]|nr:vitamin K epoxide reductase family protein [Candidatus Sulfotelmatobacter sp.]